MSIGKRHGHGVRMEKLIIRAAKLTTVVTLLKISDSDNDLKCSHLPVDSKEKQGPPLVGNPATHGQSKSP